MPQRVHRNPMISVAAFARDRFTWLAYGMLAYYAYMQAVLGPLIPFLRADLALSYTVAGLHLSAFAVGMMLAGILADRLTGRWGRRWVLWTGAIGMAIGALLLGWGSHAAVTIAAALLMGVLGSLVLVIVQAALSDHHGKWRASALTEANVAAAAAGALAPVAIASFQGAGPGWRWALAMGALISGLAFLGFGREPVPEAPDAGPSEAAHASLAVRPRRVLPGLFWIYWIVLLLVVSSEWCVLFWGAEFLENGVGFPRVTAASLMTLIWVAYVLGRYAGSRLTRTISVSRLLLIAFVLSLAGFPLFWLAPAPWLNAVGLFIVGLGFSNLFPLTLSVALGAAPDQANAASARISLGAGLAILSVPFLLGALADRAGIQAAFTVTAALLLVGTGVVVLTNRYANGSLPHARTIQETSTK